MGSILSSMCSRSTPLLALPPLRRQESTHIPRGVPCAFPDCKKWSGGAASHLCESCEMKISKLLTGRSIDNFIRLHNWSHLDDFPDDYRKRFWPGGNRKSDISPSPRRQETTSTSASAGEPFSFPKCLM
jgi:hypothetical protein